MSPDLISWQNQGSYVAVGARQHKVFVFDCGSRLATAGKTLLLLHGFPESSYSFHAVLDGLMRSFDRVVLFDMLGYGMSDKPVYGYTYSLFEQADTAMMVWNALGIKGGHLLAHDMGDSVATELLARHENDILPGWFSDGFQTITFTNGSMVLDLANLRITQRLLLSRMGPMMRRLTTFGLFKQQVQSAHGNNNLSLDEITKLWECNTLQDGHRKTHLLIKYLNDRKRFEKTRWLPALSNTKIPLHLCWGDQDAVARIVMAHYLKDHVCKEAQLTIMKDVGHFCQLGSPEKWLESTGAFYNN